MFVIRSRSNNEYNKPGQKWGQRPRNCCHKNGDPDVMRGHRRQQVSWLLQPAWLTTEHGLAEKSRKRVDSYQREQKRVDSYRRDPRETCQGIRHRGATCSEREGG